MANVVPAEPGDGGTAPVRTGSPIRARALIAAAVLVPGATHFFVWRTWRGPEGHSILLDSLVGPAVALLALLAALNVLLRRWKPQWALYRGELIALYLVVAVVAGLTATCSVSASSGWGGALAASIVWPVGSATPGNDWANLIWPNLPQHLTVMDRGVLSGFFLGDSTPYRRDILLAWLTPALWWTAYVTAFVWVCLFVSVIVRRRWSEEEKLPFPMTLLPLQLTDPKESIFRSPLWWGALVFTAILGTLNILHVFFPAIPTIPTTTDILPLVANNPPWDALRTFYLSWDPWYIGLAYLMPVDIAFSLIVFNLLWRAEYVLCRLGGWTISAWGAEFPYGDQQVVGGFAALVAIALWLDRRYLVQVLRKAVGLPSHADDSGEAFSYRTAVCGALAGAGFLCWFLVRGGMSWGLAVAYLGITAVLVAAILRVRAQFGPPSHNLAETMQWTVLTQYPGMRALSPRGLTMLALQMPFMWDQNAHPAPTQLEGLRMAERGTINARHLGLVLLAVIPLAMLVYFWSNLHLGYSLGLSAKANARLGWVADGCTGGRLDPWLRDPGGLNQSATGAMGVGFGVTALLMFVKLRFPLWPLHPVAFPFAFNWTIDLAMPAIIATWLVKASLLRYGGLRAHRRALPFFLGLIVGSAVMSLVRDAIIWAATS